MIFFIFHAMACFFGKTIYFKKEIEILQQLKKKIVILPYGGDSYMYSRLFDLSFRHAMLISYPEAAKKESYIADRFTFLLENSDCIFSGMFVDGVARWDILMPMVYGN